MASGLHFGWYREQDRESDTVSISLLFGSLLAVCPSAIATWVNRTAGDFSFVNEFGFLIVSILLLASGVVLRLKSTTMVGTSATIIYFLTLLIYVPWGQLNKVAIDITIGSGSLFGFGLALAVFRDRLLLLPEKIKHRQGMFHVLSWR